jgi:predicted nucleic acid-binding protein
MKLVDIPTGTALFVDANIFVYHFGADPVFGPPCRDFMERVLRGEVFAFTSSFLLSNLAHRLMTLEAAAKFGWTMTKVAYRLKRQPAELQTLLRFRQSVEEIPRFGVRVLGVELPHVLAATLLSQQHGLLSGDALVVAVMQANGLTNLASHDSDFDRVPGITRYAPG